MSTSASATSPIDSLSQVKALTFDVFGTCVDWRSSIEKALAGAAAAKMASPAFTRDVPAPAQKRVRALTQSDWATFAQAWRDSYGRFTRGFVPGGDTPWKDVDAHHRDSLLELLDAWGLTGLYAAHEVEALSRAWHALRPWPDSSAGIRRLGGGGSNATGDGGTRSLTTAALSNGNQALLRDLDAHAELGFHRLLSAEDFRAYKPHPSVYRGACAALGRAPDEVAMVAAHLGDLAGARACGLRTIYVERPGEEAWQPGEERYRDAQTWVDLWVPADAGGFLEVARRLGIP